ncbi:MAG: LEPR-XLL domain-containing protein, partial [Betaproteobacteria bacterium]|nr:LEPR-XLL domain-containing protein [Betaproteobacteria bacterium]
MFKGDLIKRWRSRGQTGGSAKPPHRRKVLFEQLEARLLLSASPPGVPLVADSAAQSELASTIADVTPVSVPAATAAVSPSTAPADGDRAGSSTHVTVDIAAPSSSAMSGQWFVIDLDGAQDVSYDGPVRVDGVDVDAFAAPAALAGREEAIVASMLEALAGEYPGLGVTFSLTPP